MFRHSTVRLCLLAIVLSWASATAVNAAPPRRTPAERKRPESESSRLWKERTKLQRERATLQANQKAYAQELIAFNVRKPLLKWLKTPAEISKSEAELKDKGKHLEDRYKELTRAIQANEKARKDLQRRQGLRRRPLPGKPGKTGVRVGKLQARVPREAGKRKDQMSRPAPAIQ